MGGYYGIRMAVKEVAEDAVEYVLGKSSSIIADCPIIGIRRLPQRTTTAAQ